MRAKNDQEYHGWKESASDGFGLLKRGWKPEEVVEFLFEEEAGEGRLAGTSVMLFILSIAEYEVRHNILEERILYAAAYHIYRYENMGRYRDDLEEEEIEELNKDIAYIKSKIELPILSPEDYADIEYQEAEDYDEWE